MEELLAGSFHVSRIPGISSPVYFLSLLGLSLEEAALVSCHGREQELIPMLLEGKKVCALLGGRSQLSGLCEKLVFYGLSDVGVTAGERLSYPEERIKMCIRDRSCINTEEMIPLLEKAGLREAVMEKLQEAIDSYV